MPTCQAGEPKNTRSPGLGSLTGVAAACCADAVRGREIPALPKTYWVKPEQSKPDGLVPPYTYGMPSSERAMLTTSLEDCRTEPDDVGRTDDRLVLDEEV